VLQEAFSYRFISPFGGMSRSYWKTQIGKSKSTAKAKLLILVGKAWPQRGWLSAFLAGIQKLDELREGEPMVHRGHVPCVFNKALIPREQRKAAGGEVPAAWLCSVSFLRNDRTERSY
jgi:hypothetical protein